MKPKLLIYGDFYPVPSGFGRQIRDILPHLTKEFEVLCVPLNFENYNWNKKPDYDILARIPNSSMSFEWVDELAAILAYPDWTPDCVLAVNDLRYITRAFPSIKDHPKTGWVLWACYEGSPLPESYADILSRVDYFVPQTKFLEAKFKKLLPFSTLKYEVVYPPVNKNIFHALSTEANTASRKALGIPKDDWIIFAIGKNQVRKNWGTLIEAVAGIENAWLVLITANVKNDKAYDLEGLAKSHKFNKLRIVSNQEVPDDELNRYYNVADVVVCPSHYEGIGMPLLEAMACDKPIIAPNYGPMAEIAALGNKYTLVDGILEHDVDGFKAIHISAENLRSAIVNTMAMYSGKLTNAFNVVPMISGYLNTPEKAATRLTEIVNQVIDQKQKRRFNIVLKNYL